LVFSFGDERVNGEHFEDTLNPSRSALGVLRDSRLWKGKVPQPTPAVFVTEVST